jgi:GNAT superfamily N-acetyltransferase
MQRKDIEIVEGDLNELKDVYQRFKEDFAPVELKSYEHLELLLTKEKYKLVLAKDKIVNEIMGYAFIYEFTNLKAIWLDYIAIDKKFRSSGYGSIFFRKLANYKQNESSGVFLEVEIPEDSQGHIREEQIRRINFYERLGAKNLDIPYELPTNDGGFPMYLYYRPCSGVEQLTMNGIQEAIAEVFEFIHSDVKNRDNILHSLLT